MLFPNKYVAGSAPHETDAFGSWRRYHMPPKRDEKCIKPDKVASDENCHCYNKPENDFEYAICKEPKKG